MSKRLIKINPVLGNNPNFLIFFPSSQALPIGIILAILIIIINVLGIPGKPGFFLSVCTIISWLAATGSKPWELIDQLIPPPGANWIYSLVPYLSPIPEQRPNRIRTQIKDSQLTQKLKPVTVKNYHKKQVYQPFSNYQDLVCPIVLKVNGKEITSLLLNRGTQTQLVFCFKYEPLHTYLSESDIEDYHRRCSLGISTMPEREYLTFYGQKYSFCGDTINYLERVAQNCELSQGAILTRNRQRKVQELTTKGIRQNYSHVVTATYSFNSAGQKNTDFLSQFIDSCFNCISWITGSQKQQYQQDLELQIEEAYRRGYLIWQSTLSDTLGLEAKPMNLKECWQWLWNEFNNPHIEPEPIPNYLSWNRQEGLKEHIFDDKHCISVLTEGREGISSTPEHKKAGNAVWLPGRASKCGLLVMSSKSARELSPKEQIENIFHLIYNADFQNIEIVSQLYLADKNQVLGNLKTINTQASSNMSKAAEESPYGRDVVAEEILNEAYEAERILRGNGEAVYFSTVIKLYRQTNAQLEEDCLKLARRFGDGKLIRESNLAWKIYLETLSITISPILQKTSIYQDRRLTLDNESYYRFLPLVCPKDLDQHGTELLGEGGKPLHLDLFNKGTKRIVIIGESGSGKSVLGWDFIEQAIALNYPVVGMDASPGTGNSFAAALNLLKDKGAYIDISVNNLNLLELPDLRKFKNEKFYKRLTQWQTSILSTLNGYINDGIEDNLLTNRVENLTLTALTNFLKDPRIKRRYHEAIEQGWQSEAWPNIPTLKDYLKFCTRGKLGLISPEPIDREALHLIQTQLKALLESPIGQRISQPSNFSPEPLVKFFTISQLDNPREQALVANVIGSTCLRIALTAEKSLMFGDEVSTLFEMDSFAQIWGQFHSIGRKNGISMVTIGHDISDIENCIAAERILKNINYTLIGKITDKGVLDLVNKYKYPEEVLYQNSSEAYSTSQTKGCSRWLVIKDSKFWHTEFYPSDLGIALIANNREQTAFREKINQKYNLEAITGKIKALREFYQSHLKVS